MYFFTLIESGDVLVGGGGVLRQQFPSHTHAVHEP